MGPAVRKALIAGGLGFLFLSAGCATDKDRRAQEVTGPVTSIPTMRQELVKAQAQVDDVLTAMHQVRMASAAELPQTYEDFTRRVSEIARQADSAHQRALQMQGQEQQYVARWETETEQRQVVRQNYPRLQEAARAVDAAYPPFLTQLRDIEKALSQDLTPAGVKEARPVRDDARSTGTALKERIANFIAQLDLLRATPRPTE